MLDLEVCQKMATDHKGNPSAILKDVLDASDNDFKTITWTKLRSYLIQLQYYTATSQDEDHNLFTNANLMLTNTSLGGVIGSVISKVSERYKKGVWVNQDPSNKTNPFDCPACFLDTEQDPSFAQKVKLSKEKSIIVIGDIHSSIGSVVEIIDELKIRGILDDNLKLASTKVLICTGDMVDRGPYSLEVLYVMFLLMDRNDGQVFITNGNHEDYRMYAKRNGKDTMELEMKTQLSETVSKIVHTVLRYLPCVLFVNFDGEWLQFCHGGIDAEYDPKAFLGNDNAVFELHGYDHDVVDPNGYTKHVMINEGLRWTDFTNRSLRDMEDIFHILSKFEISKDLLGDDVIDNFIIKNISRGAGYIFTPESTDEYLKYNNIVGIVRGHQDLYCLGLIAHANTVAQIAMSDEYQSRTPLVSIKDMVADIVAEGRVAIDANYTRTVFHTYGIDQITEEEPSLLFVKSVHMKPEFGSTGTWSSTIYDNVFKDFSVVTTSTATNARKYTLYFHTFSIISKRVDTAVKPDQEPLSNRFLLRNVSSEKVNIAIVGGTY